MSNDSASVSLCSTSLVTQSTTELKLFRKTLVVDVANGTVESDLILKFICLLHSTNRRRSFRCRYRRRSDKRPLLQQMRISTLDSLINTAPPIIFLAFECPQKHSNRCRDNRQRDQTRNALEPNSKFILFNKNKTIKFKCKILFKIHWQFSFQISAK